MLPVQVNVNLTFGNPIEALHVLTMLGGGNATETEQGLTFSLPLNQAQPAARPTSPAQDAGIVDVSGQPVSAQGGAPIVAPPTFGDVESAAQQHAKRHGIPSLKAVLAEFGVERARNLTEDQYPAVIERLGGAGA